MSYQKEIYFFQQDLFYLETYEWTTCTTETLKSDFFYQLQLFSMKIFQKQITPTVPKLEVSVTVGNTLAGPWQLKSWNVSYFHSSYNCLSSSAFIEENGQNSTHSFWIKIKACHWEMFHIHFLEFFFLQCSLDLLKNRVFLINFFEKLYSLIILVLFKNCTTKKFPIPM